MADSNPAGLEAWMPGCSQDWSRLKSVAARWEEGLEGIPTCSTLQEFGGLHFIKSPECHFDQTRTQRPQNIVDAGKAFAAAEKPQLG